jgi:endo-1,4-beta-mannosidase
MITGYFFRKEDYIMKGYIKIHDDNWNFVNDNSGEIFVPFGANYFDPETGWAPKLWVMFDEKRVQHHFQKMTDIGVNTARIFLTAQSFQPKSDIISKDGLDKLDIMIGIAKSYGIRLILTGPDHWEGRPDYWGSDKYAGESALTALEFFWHEVANKYKDENAILAWDLLNEPEVGWKSEAMTQKWHLWLADKYGADEAEIPEDKIDSGNKTLYDYQLFREFIAYEWTRRQVEAIRAVDPNHLVTVGLIQWSFPLLRAPWGEKGNLPSRYAGFNP